MRESPGTEDRAFDDANRSSQLPFHNSPILNKPIDQSRALIKEVRVTYATGVWMIPRLPGLDSVMGTTHPHYYR